MKIHMKKTLILLSIMLLYMVAIPMSFGIESDKYEAVSIYFISQTPDPVEPGDYVDLRWSVENRGGEAAEYFFKLEYDYPFSLDNGEEEIKTPGIIGPYQNEDDSAIIKWRVRVDEEAIEGLDNEVRVLFWKRGESESNAKATGDVEVDIKSSEGLLTIGNIDMMPKQVETGEEFELKLTLENLGDNFVNNVKVLFDVDSSQFTPIGNSNQKTIKTIPGRDSREVSLKFFVNNNAEVKVHSVPVNLTFTDKFGNEYKSSTTVGIPVYVKPTYLANLESTEIYTKGAKGKVVVSISNIASGDMNYVVLEMKESEDYEILSSAKSYLGNLESDDFETGQFDIYINGVDKENVPLGFVMTYRDSYDQLHQDEFTLNNKIYSSSQAKRMGLVSGSSSGFIFILLIVLVGLIIWYRKGKTLKNLVKKFRKK